jgi:hypothetical protein
MFEESNLIHGYTRAEALADGVLVDVTNTAKQAGIRYPAALTRAVWERCVKVPPGVVCQDEGGRLWDAVWLLACAIRCSDGGPVLRFGVHVQNDDSKRTPLWVPLMAVCGPDDQGEPVITVLLLGED